MEARSKIVKETEAFNAAEEKRLRISGKMKTSAAKKQGQRSRGQRRQASPQPVKVEITVTSQGYDENYRSETYIGPGYYHTDGRFFIQT